MYQTLLRKLFRSAYGIAYLYLSSSMVIFLLGFFKLWIGIPVTLLFLYAVSKSIYEAPEQRISFRMINFKWIAVIITILIWVIICGIGGYMSQTVDHLWRNVMYTDLVQFSWPIVRGDAVFVYYIGFWLPSALVGKLLGIEAGFVFQVIWATIGITLTFIMLCDYLGKFRYWFLLVFIFWGVTVFCCYPGINEFLRGKNILEIRTLYYAIFGNSVPRYAGIESPRNFIIIRWVFNQGIPFWVAFMLILKLIQSKKYLPIFLICSILLISSPFQAIPIGLFCAFGIIIDKNNWAKEKYLALKNNIFFNIENVATFFVVLLVAFFYKSNTSASHFGMLVSSKTLLGFIYFFIGCFGIYFVFVPKLVIKNPYILFLAFVTFILSFIQIGFRYDFSFRTWYPFSFLAMVFVLECLINVKVEKIKKYMFVIFILSSVPFGIIEMQGIISRTIKNGEARLVSPFTTVLHRTNKTVNYNNNDYGNNFAGYNNNGYCNNFVGSVDSIYYHYLAPHREILPDVWEDTIDEEVENNNNNNISIDK